MIIDPSSFCYYCGWSNKNIEETYQSKLKQWNIGVLNVIITHIISNIQSVTLNIEVCIVLNVYTTNTRSTTKARKLCVVLLTLK